MPAYHVETRTRTEYVICNANNDVIYRDIDSNQCAEHLCNALNGSATPQPPRVEIIEETDSEGVTWIRFKKYYTERYC